MITREEHESVLRRTKEIVRRSGVVLRPEEMARFEVLDFGLGEIEACGLQMVCVLETDAVAVRLAVMLPGQTCPEHMHPRVGEYGGKEETFRCVWGELYVHRPGPAATNPVAVPPAHRADSFTSEREAVLAPGEQVTSLPGERHWVQGGPDGAVAWLFCSRVTDAQDQFTDPDVRRMDPVVEGG